MCSAAGASSAAAHAAATPRRRVSRFADRAAERRARGDGHPRPDHGPCAWPAELLVHDGEHVVARGRRQVAARGAAPEAGRTGRAARLGARQRQHLEARAAPVALRRQIAVDAIADVAETRGAERERDQQHDGRGHQPAARDAGARERRERHAQRDRGGGEVRLGDQHQHREQRERERERPGRERPARAATGGGAVASPRRHQQAGRADQERRRISRDRPEPQPAAGAGGAHADARNEHRRRRDQRRQEQRRGRAQHALDADAHDHPAERAAEHDADGLSDRVVVGGAETGRPRPRSRAGDDREIERRQSDAPGPPATRPMRFGRPSQKRTSKPMPASKMSPNSGLVMPARAVGRVAIEAAVVVDPQDGGGPRR